MATPNVNLADRPELLFPPAHKSAMGIAIGTAAAVSCFALTAIALIRGVPPGLDLGLLAQYFKGYEVSWQGALIGAAWAGFTGFVAGWFFAFLRNALMAFRLVILKARAELAQTRDFMDHI